MRVAAAPDNGHSSPRVEIGMSQQIAWFAGIAGFLVCIATASILSLGSGRKSPKRGR